MIKMERISSQKAFRLLTENIGFKPLAVGFYRTMTSRDPVFVLETEERASWFRIVMKRILRGGDITFSNPEHTLKEFTILSKEAYKKNWKDFSGWEICIMEDEKTVKNLGVNVLSLTLMKLQRESHNADIPADYFLNQLHQLIARLAETVSLIRKEMKQENLDKLKQRSKLKSILQKNLKNDREKKLLFHLLEVLEDRVLGG